MEVLVLEVSHNSTSILPYFHTFILVFSVLVLFPWQFLLPLCGIINEGGDNRCGLFHILPAEVVISVHIAVMCPGSIFHRVLDELKSRQSDCVK